ncbi:SRPBCC family protein [Telluribacter sp. SYSU D00476]|uniref:SRPBCC family protein n=1 Tax=Telluribacter sp. SYSU D00476 TaxID=2811430 RepID=UPI001FF259B5|nr:SRPBCC family protein [Telluribacter sp. SYSU D00476]
MVTSEMGMPGTQNQTTIEPVASGSSRVNVGGNERIVSTTAGALLTYYGLRKPSLGRLLAATLGGWLIYRGTSGYCHVNNVIGRDTSEGATLDSIGLSSSVTINKPRAEVYRYWRQLENLPKFMHHLDKVTQIDSKRSHWCAPVPGGITKLEWDAEIVEDRENECIVWRSVPGAAVDNAGEVRFKDSVDGKGTEVHSVIRYQPPAGYVGDMLSKLFNPAFKKMVKQDMRRFKHLMETGEEFVMPDPTAKHRGVDPNSVQEQNAPHTPLHTL